MFELSPDYKLRCNFPCLLDGLPPTIPRKPHRTHIWPETATYLPIPTNHSIAPYHAHVSYRTPKPDTTCDLNLYNRFPDIVNGYATNEISLHSIHCIVSSEAQFETWWWPNERAETCSLSNKYYTTLLVVFDCTILYHHNSLGCWRQRRSSAYSACIMLGQFAHACWLCSLQTPFPS